MRVLEPLVFVIDDDPSVLRGVGRLLRSARYGVEVYDSPRAFIDQATPDRPGCVIADLRMPELDGLDLLEELMKRGCAWPIIFLTGYDDVPSSVQAMKAGAVDFLSKPCEGPVLLEAVARALARDAKERGAKAEVEALRSRFEMLTPREREVCMLVAQGLLNKQIAAELGAAEKTVKVHRGRVMKKLGVATVPDLVRLVDRLRTSHARA